MYIKKIENHEKILIPYVLSNKWKILENRIRGLPLDISDDTLSNELKLISFEPQYIRNFIKNRKSILIHMISLKITENTKGIYLVQDIFYIKVKIEPYKNSGTA